MHTVQYLKKASVKILMFVVRVVWMNEWVGGDAGEGARQIVHGQTD